MTDRINALHEAMSQRAARISGFDAITEVADILAAIPDRTAFLSALLKAARRCFMSDHEAILTYHKPTRRWFVEAAQDLKADAIDEINGLSRTVIERTRDSAVSVLISDTTSDELTRGSQSVRLFNIQSVLTAPIQMKEDLWGMIYLANTGVPGAFDDESQRQIAAFARFASIAIQRCEEFVGFNLPPLNRSEVPTPLLENVRSASMVRAMHDIKLAAPTDAPILLLGETGTGKNVIAKWIHDHSTRRSQPFVEINCAELDVNLIGLELFGIESGVATGVSFREGKIKVADGGTVFINEIGELPLTVQSKLLRVVEERVVERIGARSVLGVDVRFICATHRNLTALVESGQFRSDLFHRINVFEVMIPPLRERIEDIPRLTLDLVEAICKRMKRPTVSISHSLLNDLITRRWDGNIRELAYTLERAIIRGNGEALAQDGQRGALSRSEDSGIVQRVASLRSAVDEFEKSFLRQSLEHSGWVKSRAAKSLGIPLSTLQSKLKKFGINRPPRLR